MMIQLIVRAFLKYALGFALLVLFIFIPAGTWNFFQGWLFMGILFIPVFFLGLYLLLKDPDLLEKRLNAREEQMEQKMVIVFSSLMFIAGFILAGLNYRFRWIILPMWVSYVAAAVFLLSYAVLIEVMKENAFLSRTIEIQEGQKVVDTGMYSVVRHPMYSVTIILFLSIPLVLGSVFSFLVFLFYPFIIAKRIRNEEKVLEKELDGYMEYKQRVKYKVIPFIW